MGGGEGRCSSRARIRTNAVALAGGARLRMATRCKPCLKTRLGACAGQGASSLRGPAGQRWATLRAAPPAVPKSGVSRITPVRQCNDVEGPLLPPHKAPTAHTHTRTHTMHPAGLPEQHLWREEPCNALASHHFHHVGGYCEARGRVHLRWQHMAADRAGQANTVRQGRHVGTACRVHSGELGSRG